MEDRNRPLEHAFAASSLDERRRATIGSSLRQVMMDCGVFGGDPVRTQELLGLVDTWLRFTCPLGADEESQTIAGLYGMIIILHGTGILTGAHLELTPEAFVRHMSTGMVECDDPPESARLLAELGRRFQARSVSREAMSLFLHYADRTYRAYRDRREALLRGARAASLSEYERNRAFRIGLYPWVWLWNALHGLVAPALVLGDERLRRMLELTNQITYMRNDVATLRRDLHDGIENYVLYLEEGLGCGRARAIEIVKERCNDKVREVLELKRAVVSSPGGHPVQEIAGYLGFLESLLIANLLVFEAFGGARYVEMDTLAK
jgi:hypothetical protein